MRKVTEKFFADAQALPDVDIVESNLSLMRHVIQKALEIFYLAGNYENLACPCPIVFNNTCMEYKFSDVCLKLMSCFNKTVLSSPPRSTFPLLSVTEADVYGVFL